MDGNEGVLFGGLDGEMGSSIFPYGDPLPRAAHASGCPLAGYHIAVAPCRHARLQQGIQSASNEKGLVTDVRVMRGKCEWRWGARIPMYHEHSQLGVVQRSVLSFGYWA